ncbi:MAG TPA: hypothetical protein VFK05_00145 [Polyangiaceae bacterium]|nr:hypothetical protein [Polyangiaceae bacterium]
MRVHAKIWALSAAIGVYGCAQGGADAPAHGRPPQNIAGDDEPYGGILGPHAGSGGKLGTGGTASSLSGGAGRGVGGAGGSGNAPSAGAGGSGANAGLTGAGGHPIAGASGGSSTATDDCSSLTRVRLKTGACVDRITEYSVASAPTSIVTGSDGQVWVDDDGSNQLLQLDSEGRVLKRIECAQGSSPRTLIGGSDDALVWYTDAGAKRLRRLTQTTEMIIELTFTATAIARGEGDELWMSEAGQAIYQVRPYVGIQPYAVAPSNALVLGPDKKVWFPTGGLMAQLTPAGETRYFSLGSSFADELCVGPDGALWFTDSRRHQIGRMDLDGKSQTFDLPLGSAPTRIIQGPDGALWFTEEGGDKIGRITLKGDVITQYPIPTNGGLPHALTLGADGKIWFTERASGKVGRLIPDGG